MQTARDVVLDLLRKWIRLEEPPFLPERTDEVFANLSDRNRPFAFDLITGIIRWRKTLDAVIQSQLRQTLDTLDRPVVAVLWLGAYQLLFQGGTADYAAVDSAVELAKKHRDTIRAGGLVNAVLRNITRLEPKVEPRIPGAAALTRRTLALDFETQLRFNEDLFLNPAANPIGHLAQVRSHPPQFVEHLRNLYADSKAADLLLRNNLRPVVTLRADSAALDVPALAGLVAHSETPRFLVAKAGWNQSIEELVRKGILSPQDPTAAKPVRHLESLVTQNEIPAPKKILDLCAGLGTKSLQLTRAFPTAQITSADIDSVKLARLAARIKHVKQPNVTLADSPIPPAEKFDLILVDVPCSNTGVMAKRVQSRWRWPNLDHPALQSLQLKLLHDALAAAAENALLLYSTCSIDPAENSTLIQKFLASAPAKLHLLHQESTLPSLTNAPESTHDGGYFAILRKTPA